MKPLFIPLKGEYYDAFAAGTKTRELRLYGPRWNIETCVPGREVILSRGYGKKHRMRGYIADFDRVAPGCLCAEDWLQCFTVYDRLDRDIAVIEIEGLR